MMLKDQTAILSFWRDIEIFNLPDFPAEAKLYKTGDPLPWTIPHDPSKEMVWQHIVFLGKLAKKDVTAEIEDAITYVPDAEETWVEKISGYTYMAAIVINEQGYTSQDRGYLQASYIHGLKCLQNNLPLSAIEDQLYKQQESFKERFPLDPEAEKLEGTLTKVINWSHLIKETDVLNALAIKGVQIEQEVFIKSFRISKYAKPDIAFLNSFYLADLNNLISEKGKWADGLKKLISIDTDKIDRTDLLNDSTAFWKTIDPENMPAGRWPSNPVWGLYSAQLGAVSNSLSVLKKKNGILGINGPPGTGKTTLLADIVADIIVTRAIKLMDCNISSLFGRTGKLDREGWSFYYYATDAAVFNDAGIVVASNNNAAVENISKELPSSEKIDLDSFPQAGYFTELATDLISGESWGVLAAALGNAENKQSFKNKFWYPAEDRKGFEKLLKEAYDKEDDRTEEYLHLFQQVKTELKTLLQEFKGFKTEAAHFHALLPQFLQDQQALVQLKEELDVLKAAIASFSEKKAELKALYDQISSRILSLQESIKLHQLTKPSLFFFQKLIKSASFKQWKESGQLYLTELNAQTKELVETQEPLDLISKELKPLKTHFLKGSKLLKDIEERLEDYQIIKQSLREKYGIAPENIPDEILLEQYHAADKSNFHKSNPWSSVKINTLRSNIFLLSLKLHEYAILSNAKSFRNNLNLFIEYLDGRVTVKPELAESLWKTFFFCIPVVSTTLASASRLFESLGKESIGWLLIDEAGQATPQSAAGLINRAQKTIIIGDPLQIEPVVTINKKLVNVLSAEHDTSLIWSPHHNSVQTLADRVSSKGAWLTDYKNEETWTGFPLRTHRRCNNPMFDLANQIAYEKQMVKAQPDTDFECESGDSAWFDVKGKTVEDKQVVMEEITLLKQKIALLKHTDTDIFIISPFKSVAMKCASTFMKSKNIKCGTIHTFQGKEADIVFLVLGSDPEVAGARAWAAEKPNMLNVALTRAKKRFYVIGNKSHWKGFKYFSDLEKRL